MHVLVATDGRMHVDQATDFAARLAGPHGQVTVLTVVEIPRRLLEELRQVMGEQPEVRVDADAEYVETTPPDGSPPRGWPGDDAMIARYLEDKRIQHAEPIVEALRARGVEARGNAIESEHPAIAIVEAVVDLGADVLIIGNRGQGRFQGLLGSTGTKLVRRSPVPVLVLRTD